MINSKKIVVVLPAYNAGKTLSDTYQEIPFDIVDDVILVDDNSNDNTKEIAKQLGIKHIILHSGVLKTFKKHQTITKNRILFI